MVSRHPVLFHMAERGSWSSIRARGLLSTSALLDLFGYTGIERDRIESHHRPEGVAISHAVYGTAIIRDQKPMTDSGLKRCLLDDLEPKDWYRILNDRVFFWLTEDRLSRLLNARPYAQLSHDVLFVETRSLIRDYREFIRLSPMNSGNTKPYPWPRGRDTFPSISQCPFREWQTKRRTEPVVELAVMRGIPNVEKFVLCVKEMRGDETLRVIWRRS